MKTHAIDWVIVRADRVAANGDVANKIGTYNLAVLAKHHGVKVMVALPLSSLDMNLASGDLIPIEQRGAEEIPHVFGNAVAPANCPAINPAFDVTPAELIDAIVTEHGVIPQPNSANIASHIQQWTQS